MGIAAVVGAPVLAGIAIAGALKKEADKHPQKVGKEHPFENRHQAEKPHISASDASSLKTKLAKDDAILNGCHN